MNEIWSPRQKACGSFSLDFGLLQIASLVGGVAADERTDDQQLWTGPNTTAEARGSLDVIYGVSW